MVTIKYIVTYTDVEEGILHPGEREGEWMDRISVKLSVIDRSLLRFGSISVLQHVKKTINIKRDGNLAISNVNPKISKCTHRGSVHVIVEIAFCLV